MGMLTEFKDFAIRGNVVDLAVAVIIGGAFGKIVSAMVDGIIMPVIGYCLGGVNFKDLAYTLAPAIVGTDGKETTAAVLVKYGAFFQTVVDFAIVAFVLFIVIRTMNRLKKVEEATPPAPTADIVLLTEIRDLLKK